MLQIFESAMYNGGQSEPSCCSYSDHPSDTEYLTASEDFPSDYDSCESDAEWMWKNVGLRSLQKRAPDLNIRKKKAKLSGATSKPKVSKTVEKIQKLESKHKNGLAEKVRAASSRNQNTVEPRISENVSEPSTSGVKISAWKEIAAPKANLERGSTNMLALPAVDVANDTNPSNLECFNLDDFPPLKATVLPSLDIGSTINRIDTDTEHLPEQDTTQLVPYKDITINNSLMSNTHISMQSNLTQVPEAILWELGSCGAIDGSVQPEVTTMTSPIWTAEDFPSLERKTDRLAEDNISLRPWRKYGEITEEKKISSRFEDSSQPKVEEHVKCMKEDVLDYSEAASIADESKIWKAEDFPLLGRAESISANVEDSSKLWRKPEKIAEEKLKTSTSEILLPKVIRNVAVIRRGVTGTGRLPIPMSTENSSMVEESTIIKEVCNEKTQTIQFSKNTIDENVDDTASEEEIWKIVERSNPISPQKIPDVKKNSVNSDTPFVKVLRSMPVHTNTPWRQPCHEKHTKYQYNNDSIDTQLPTRPGSSASSYTATLYSELKVDISENWQDDTHMKPRKERWHSSDSGVVSEFDEVGLEEDLRHIEDETIQKELIASPFGYQNNIDGKICSKMRLENSDDEYADDFVMNKDWELERAVEERRKKTMEDVIFNEMENEFNEEIHRLLMKENKRIPSKVLEQLRIDSSVKVLSRFCIKMFPDIVNE